MVSRIEQAGRDDVFDDDDAVGRPEGEAAPERHQFLLTLREDRAHAQRARLRGR